MLGQRTSSNHKHGRGRAQIKKRANKKQAPSGHHLVPAAPKKVFPCPALREKRHVQGNGM